MQMKPSRKNKITWIQAIISVFIAIMIVLFAATAARADTLRLVKVFPIEKEIMDICMKYKSILIFEESLENGGIGQLLLSELMKAGFRGKVRIRAVSGFVAQASSDEQLELFGLDENSINEALNAT